MSNWTGWRGRGPAPGHDWTPGPTLCFVTSVLIYGFLALALAVNYAASVSFFLLAGIGIYVGLRRGFVNGLTRPEKLAMILFAAYPTVAIICYLVGVQTNIGFRFLGRDLRFLLFIPVYLALRWANLRRTYLGLALIAGAVAAAIVSTVQVYILGIHQAFGVTGTHIVFGDIALLSGFLGATCLSDRQAKDRPYISVRRLLIILIGAGSAIWGSILSEARGSWVALPFVLIILFYNIWKMEGQTIRRFSVVIVVCLILLAALMVTVGPWRRIESSFRGMAAFIIGARDTNSPNGCIHDGDVLSALVSHGSIRGVGAQAYVRSLHLDKKKQARNYGCAADDELVVQAGAKGNAFLVLPREAGGGGGGHTVTVLASGTGWIKNGWKGSGVQVDSRRLRKYESPQSHIVGQPLIVVVPPRQRMYLIPIQQNNDYVRFLGESSVGNRLNMWRVAASLFYSHPFVGVGTGAYSALVAEYIAKGKAPPSIGGYQHAHNDYMTTVATKGVLGLTVLIAILLLPGLLGWRTFKRSRNNLVPAEVSLLAMPIFSITESMMIHSFVISWFVVCMAAVMGLALKDG